jgi:hypothetical protein
MCTSSSVFCAQIDGPDKITSNTINEKRNTLAEKRFVRSIVLIPSLEGAE